MIIIDSKVAGARDFNSKISRIGAAKVGYEHQFVRAAAVHDV
jgi:hypothetical protein